MGATRYERRQQRFEAEAALRVKLATCTQDGMREGPPLPIEKTTRQRGSDGLTPRARRFCALHAAQPDPAEAMRMVYWELGGQKPRHRCAESARRYLKSPAVQAYLAACRREFAAARAAVEKFLPAWGAPDYLSVYTRSGGDKYPFQSPRQLQTQIEAYYRSRTEQGLPVGPYDLSQWLGIRYRQLRDLGAKGGLWAEVVELAHDRYVAWLQRMMWVNERHAYAANIEMRRWGLPDDPLAAEKTKAETKAIQEGGMAALQRPVTVVLFGTPPQQQPTVKQIESQVVEPGRELVDEGERYDL
jgi:hypothetical protein